MGEEGKNGNLQRGSGSIRRTGTESVGEQNKLETRRIGHQLARKKEKTNGTPQPRCPEKEEELEGGWGGGDLNGGTKNQPPHRITE